MPNVWDVLAARGHQKRFASAVECDLLWWPEAAVPVEEDVAGPVLVIRQDPGSLQSQIPGTLLQVREQCREHSVIRRIDRHELARRPTGIALRMQEMVQSRIPDDLEVHSRTVQ